VERFNKTLCEGLAKVAETIQDWDSYIQPVLWAYRVKELRITKQTPYKLVYGLEPKLAMDESFYRENDSFKGKSIVDRLLEITDKVPQLRIASKRAIEKAQKQIDEKFQGKVTQFQKGDLVLYYDKAKAMRHDTKLENKWQGPYVVEEALDKGAYKLSIDGKMMKTTINGNLLKPFYGRSAWEPIVQI
jgi:hypothetical protein